MPTWVYYIGLVVVVVLILFLQRVRRRQKQKQWIQDGVRNEERRVAGVLATQDDAMIGLRTVLEVSVPREQVVASLTETLKKKSFIVRREDGRWDLKGPMWHMGVIDVLAHGSSARVAIAEYRDYSGGAYEANRIWSKARAHLASTLTEAGLTPREIAADIRFTDIGLVDGQDHGWVAES